MRLEAFISELLYEHDCVVLPEFGGLVANYRSARLNRKTHLISPPSKHIGFNRNLKSNDGLLTSHISVTLGISYKDAASKIDACIQEYQSRLNKEGRLVIERIGVFFNDKIGQLQFIPEEQENFLLSSFGLESVQLKFIEKQVVVEETPIVPISDSRRKNIGWKIAAAIVIPALIAGSVLLTNKSTDDNLSFASLNPFHEEKIISDFIGHEYNARLAENPEDENQLASTLENATGNIRYDFVHGAISESGIEIKNVKPAPVKAVTTEVNNDASPIHNVIRNEEKSGHYALIAGAFQVMENADNFLEKLKADGFDASFAGKKDGLQLVAYGFYASKAEAKKALQNIKETGGHAWIKKN